MGLTATAAWAQNAGDSPINDNLADAIPITSTPIDIGGTTSGATLEFPDEDQPMCIDEFHTSDHSLWYSYSPSVDGSIDIMITGPLEFNATLSVHTPEFGTGYPLIGLACASTFDDGVPLGGGANLFVDVELGTEYFIRVAETICSGGLGAGCVNLSPNSNLLPAFNLNVIGAAPLPVEMTSLDAHVEGSDVLLKWESLSETNNAGFGVQLKSESDDNFLTKGFVHGFGTTTESQNYEYRLTDLEAGMYVFRLKQLDFDGAFAFSPETEATLEVPGTHELSEAYPNPFNPSTQFSLVVAIRQNVRMVVFDAKGQLVQILFDGEMEANSRRDFSFDANGLPSGLYIYRVVGEVFADHGKMLLTK